MRWIRTRGIKGTPRREDYDYAKLLLDELRREDELFSKRYNFFARDNLGIVSCPSMNIPYLRLF
jgi:hypothetical protein